MKNDKIRQPTKKHVEEWIFENCINLSDGSYVTNLYSSDYSITDDLVINGKHITIRGDDDYLPFKFGSFESFTVNNSSLLSCVNFPVAIDNTSMYELLYTDSLNFGNFPTSYKTANLSVTYVPNISINDIFKNRKLTLRSLVIIGCFNESVFDFSKYGNISTVKYTLHLHNLPIKNLGDILSVPPQKLYSLEFKKLYSLGFSVYGSKLYEHYDIEKLNKILNKYMPKSDRKEHVMDFTMEIIDLDIAGFEDIV